MEKDAIWSAVFGDSDTDEEEARDEGEQVGGRVSSCKGLRVGSLSLAARIRLV